MKKHIKGFSQYINESERKETVVYRKKKVFHSYHIANKVNEQIALDPISIANTPITAEDRHMINTIMGLAVLAIPIPFVGPTLSMLMAAYDAKLYYDEKDKVTAGVVAMFALLPGISLASKIPGVKELGVKGMALLGSKVAKMLPLTAAEKTIAAKVAANKQIIELEVKNEAQALTAKAAAKKAAVAKAAEARVLAATTPLVNATASVIAGKSVAKVGAKLLAKKGTAEVGKEFYN